MYKTKLWGQCSNYLSLFNWELFCEKLAIKREINIHLSSRQREWLKPATKPKKYFMTSSNRTKIRELYSVCKNSSLLGIQRDLQKDNHNLQKLSFTWQRTIFHWNRGYANSPLSNFLSYYSLLTFFRFEQHIFAKFTNCFHILSLFVADFSGKFCVPF